MPGIGLGLHLAQNLIEGMGGSIEVESEPGEGSEFIVRVPVWEEPAERETVLTAPVQASQRTTDG